MRPWQTIDGIQTREGRLELRQRGERDFLITVGGRVLMPSGAHESEDELASLALTGRKSSRVLLGGLGMGYTLRAALDLLPPSAHITVAELNERVIDWCRGPLAVLTDGVAADRRVDFVVRDVARVIARAPAGHYDAIILDLYEGPHQATNRHHDPLYGDLALARSRAALAPGGVLAIWSEERDAAFEARLARAGFQVEWHRAGRGRTHIIYLGRAMEARQVERRRDPATDTPLAPAGRRPLSAEKGWPAARPRPRPRSR